MSYIHMYKVCYYTYSHKLKTIPDFPSFVKMLVSYKMCKCLRAPELCCHRCRTCGPTFAACTAACQFLQWRCCKLDKAIKK